MYILHSNGKFILLIQATLDVTFYRGTGLLVSCFRVFICRPKCLTSRQSVDHKMHLRTNPT